MIGKCLHAVTGELLSKKTRMKKLNKTYGTYYFIFLKTSSNINTKKLSKKHASWYKRRTKICNTKIWKSLFSEICFILYNIRANQPFCIIVWKGNEKKWCHESQTSLKINPENIKRTILNKQVSISPGNIKTM